MVSLHHLPKGILWLAVAAIASACAGSPSSPRTIASASPPGSTSSVGVELPHFQFGEIRRTSTSGRIYVAHAKSSVPRGYTLGMAESYRRMRARLIAFPRDRYIAAIIASPDENRLTDALTHYRHIFERLGLDVRRNETDRLRALYLLLYELAVRESDGRYYLGVDAGPNKPTDEAARMNSTNLDDLRKIARETEAGLFQSSWNFARNNELAAALFDDFRGERRTDRLLEIFSEGVGKPRQSDLRNWGVGTGTAFQKLAKEAPNFAVEYAALTLRKPGTRNYYFTLLDLMEFHSGVLSWLRSLE